MLVAAAVLSALLAGWMVCVQPFLGRRRYRRLLERVKVDPAARLQHYRRGIIFEWGGVALVGFLALLAHDRLESLWPEGTNPGVGTQVPGLALVIAGITAIYRFGGAAMRRALAVQLRPVAALLPRTTQERLTFAALAVTAGICEEVLYRGFGLAALRWLSPELGSGQLIILSGAAFGFAHLYQGAMGVVVTGVLGGYFAWIVISTGSLVPVIALHALLDVRILALPLDAVPLLDPPPATEAGGRTTHPSSP